jgi:hypothetical protein
MRAEKWRFIGGKVYRLGGVFTSSHEAIKAAKTLSSENHVHLSRDTDGSWLVYWRSREEQADCRVTQYKIA